MLRFSVSAKRASSNLARPVWKSAAPTEDLIASSGVAGALAFLPLALLLGAAARSGPAAAVFLPVVFFTFLATATFFTFLGLALVVVALRFCQARCEVSDFLMKASFASG